MRDLKFNPEAAQAEHSGREVSVMTSRRRAVAMLCGLLVFGGIGAAHAHAIVVDSSPAANAVVAPGPLELTVAFNTRLDRARSRITLAAPDGALSTIALSDDAAPTRLIGHAEVATSGLWKLRWQVLAADGHITRGEIPFRVRALAR